MRQAQQSDISAFVVAFLFIVFALAALAQCRAEPAHAASDAAPAKPKCPAGYVWKLHAKNAGYGNVIFVYGCVRAAKR